MAFLTKLFLMVILLDSAHATCNCVENVGEMKCVGSIQCIMELQISRATIRTSTLEITSWENENQLDYNKEVFPYLRGVSAGSGEFQCDGGKCK